MKYETKFIYPNSAPLSLLAKRIETDGSQLTERCHIIPLNLNAPWQTIDFRVAMNTHSVDLSMDLATLATLETNTGYVVKATRWDGPRGGHHVQGILSFPASLEGKPIMDSVTRLTLTIRDVDAAERVFVWDR